MKPSKRKALEAAGWTFGDAADFLGMTDDERQMLELRVDAALAVKRQRVAMNLSQQELARRIHTSQPRIVKIEKAAKDVTLDQILRAYAAAGGKIEIKQGRDSKRNKKNKAREQSTVQIELTGAKR